MGFPTSLDDDKIDLLTGCALAVFNTHYGNTTDGNV